MYVGSYSFICTATRNPFVRSAMRARKDAMDGSSGMMALSAAGAVTSARQSHLQQSGRRPALRKVGGGRGGAGVNQPLMVAGDA